MLPYKSHAFHLTTSQSPPHTFNQTLINHNSTTSPEIFAPPAAMEAMLREALADFMVEKTLTFLLLLLVMGFVYRFFTVQKHQQQIDELQSQRFQEKAWMQEKAALEVKLNSTEEKSKSLEASLELSSTRNDCLEDELRQCRAEKATLEVKLNSTEEKVKSLETSQEISARIGRLEREELRQCKAEVESCKIREKDCLQREARREEELQAYKADVAYLKNQESNFKRYNRRMDESFTQRNQEAEREREERIVAQAHAKAMEIARDEEKKKRVAAEAEVAALQLKLDEKEKIIARMREYFEHGAAKMTELGQEGAGQSKVTV